MRWFGFVCLFVVLWETLGVRTFPQCPRVKLNNGRVKLRQRGRFMEYFCNNGYLRAGERLSICIQGKWDSAPPKCVRPTCHPVKPAPNSLIYPSHSGGVLTFYCKQGFQLRGHSVIYCDGKNWDNNSPTCLPSHTKPALSCDFESEDLCHWTHDFNYDFTWTRLNFATPSGIGAINTGPKYDHTKGEHRGGFYMYIESSSRNINDTARLISPIYDATTKNTCFEFYYHMFGKSIGELRVFVKKASQNWTLDPSTAFFDMRGNQGNHWFRSITQLGPIPEDFQIVVEGVRGDSYESDIAIDDVKLIRDCHLSEEPTTTEFWEREAVFTYLSCRNRCGHSYKDIQHLTLKGRAGNGYFPCGCTPDCYVGFHCCSDYFEFCVAYELEPKQDAKPESDEYTTEDITSYNYPETTTELIVSSTSYPEVDTTTITDTEATETEEVTSRTTIQPTIREILTSRKVTTISTITTTLPTTTMRPTTTPRKLLITTKSIPIKTESRTTIIPRTPPTRKATTRKHTLLPLVLTKELEEGAKKAWYTLIDDVEKFTFRPALASRKTPAEKTTKIVIATTRNPGVDNITEVDEVELPWNNSDEGSFVNNPAKADVDNDEDRKNKIEKEIKNEINRDYFSRGKHAESMMKAGRSTSGHTSIIIICSLLLASIVVVGGILGYRKYRALPYSKNILRLRRPRHGSQSDVFYLTNEEQLNFTLNYDTL